MIFLKRVKFLINALIRRGYWYNNTFLPDCRKFSTYSTFNTQVVNLGSTSAVAAFDYSELGIKAANWALRRNPLQGDLAILQNYVSYLDNKKNTVIIPLCPFSALSGSYEIFEERYYSILYASSIPSYSYVHNVQAQDKISNPIMYYPWYALFIDLWHLFFNGENKKLSEYNMKLDADIRIRGWLHEFSLKDFNTPLSLINKDNITDAINIVKNIFDYCKDRNAEPVLVVLPMYHSLAEQITAEAFEKLFGDLEALAIEHNVKFLNYMNDNQFSIRRDLFKNSFLLNNKGAKLFTKQILTDLDII